MWFQLQLEFPHTLPSRFCCCSSASGKLIAFGKAGMQDLWGMRSCCSDLMIHAQQMLQSCRLHNSPRKQLQSGATQQTEFSLGHCHEEGREQLESTMCWPDQCEMLTLRVALKVPCGCRMAAVQAPLLSKWRRLSFCTEPTPGILALEGFCSSEYPSGRCQQFCLVISYIPLPGTMTAENTDGKGARMVSSAAQSAGKLNGRLQCRRHTARCLVPERHVAAAEAVSQGSPHGHEAGAGGVPGMRVAGVEHLLFLEVLPACTCARELSAPGKSQLMAHARTLDAIKPGLQSE